MGRRYRSAAGNNAPAGAMSLHHTWPDLAEEMLQGDPDHHHPFSALPVPGRGCLGNLRSGQLSSEECEERIEWLLYEAEI